MGRYQKRKTVRVREETERGMEETKKHGRGGKSKTYNTVNTHGSTKEHSEQEFNI